MTRFRKYQRLIGALRDNGSTTVDMTFDEMAQLVGGLPPSATKYNQWWQNSRYHSQARAWLDAGYRVQDVDRDAERVRFSKIS